MPGPEQQMDESVTEWKAPDATTEAREEERYIRKEYEYRGADGELLGRAEAEIDPNQRITMSHDTKEGGPAQGVLLRSLVLKGEKDGQPVQRDVLALANKHGVPVFMAERRLKTYCYSTEAGAR